MAHWARNINGSSVILIKPMRQQVEILRKYLERDQRGSVPSVLESWNMTDWRRKRKMFLFFWRIIPKEYDLFRESSLFKATSLKKQTKKKPKKPAHCSKQGFTIGRCFLTLVRNMALRKRKKIDWKVTTCFSGPSAGLHFGRLDPMTVLP